MTISINTDILKEEGLSIGEFLVMLLGCYELDYRNCCNKLVASGIGTISVIDKTNIVLSDNSKKLVAKILMKSDALAINSGVNFEELADKLRDIYPKGNKPGTTYPWRATTEEIAQKLRVLVVRYNFKFTEEEAIRAVREYVSAFQEPKHMLLLKRFLLRTSHDKEISSEFMSIIENNREKCQNI